MDRGQLTLMGSTVCLMLTMHFSIQLLSEHILAWKKPKEQKAILIIILMAPIYAIDSFVGLVDFRGSTAFFMFLESVKECYEALVMAKFLALMYTYLNISISKNIVPDEIKGREIHHSFPMTLFQPHTVHLNHNTLKLLKYWTWQFVVIRPVCSVLMIALQIVGVYPSWVSWTFTIILNISVSLALYSLVVFYHVFAKELAPHKPLAKFLCIKGIVFFCFWQVLFIWGSLPFYFHPRGVSPVGKRRCSLSSLIRIRLSWETLRELNLEFNHECTRSMCRSASLKSPRKVIS